MNKLVTIEKRGTAQDAAGQVKATWQKIDDVWASIQPVSAREYMAASGERAEVTHQIIIRHGPDVKPKDRIVYEGRVFDVVAPLNLNEENRYLQMMSTEHAD